MAPSVHPRSPSSRKLRERSESPVRGRSSAAYFRSPRKRSLSNEKMERPKSKHRDSSPRARSPIRSKPSSRGESSVRETKFSGPSSPKHSKSFANKDSPISRSPSPRSKRPRQAQADREVDRDMERERVRERGNVKNGDAEKHKKRVIEKDVKNDIRPAHESRSSLSRSPSPRTKRLKRVQAEREAAQDAERGKERNNDSDRHKRKSNEGASIDRKPADEGHKNSLSHSKHARSTSSSDLARRNHDRSESPVRRSGSASQERKHDARAGARQEARARKEEAARDSGDDSVAKMKAAEEALEAKQQKPSFELSGKLAEETNRVKGVTLLFTEPSDARKPDMRWRLYVFKGGEVLNEPLYIHRQSCYLFGRERRVADVPTDHPSCSKQHAVIQFKLAEKEGADGLMTKRVRPYVMDLGSTNGTFINDNRIEPQRYYELIEKDTLKFGNSSREYVILHENSAE